MILADPSNLEDLSDTTCNSEPSTTPPTKNVEILQHVDNQDMDDVRTNRYANVSSGTM